MIIIDYKVKAIFYSYFFFNIFLHFCFVYKKMYIFAVSKKRAFSSAGLEHPDIKSGGSQNQLKNAKRGRLAQLV